MLVLVEAAPSREPEPSPNTSSKAYVPGCQRPFKDLLNSVDPEDDVSGSSSAEISMCPTCLSMGRSVPHTPGSPCVNCFPDKPLARLCHVPKPLSQVPQPILFKPLPDHFSRRSSHSSSDLYVNIKTEPQQEDMPELVRTSHLPTSPFRLARRPPSIPLTVTTASPNLVSQGLTPAKIASNDRHKLSEKHRRDGMGAFVQASYVLRKGLNPGALLGCCLCMSSVGSTSPAFSASTGTTPSSHSPINPLTVSVGAVKPKKPKNDMLEEGLMWEFAWLLHIVPGQVQEHLDEIHRLAEQKARDKEFGMRNDWAKKKKWDADVRAEVLGRALRVMEAECERHGLAFGHPGSGTAGADTGASNSSDRRDGIEEGPNPKRRKLNDIGREGAEEAYKMAAVLTPPSSSGSPVLSALRPREASEECGEERV